MADYTGNPSLRLRIKTPAGPGGRREDTPRAFRRALPHWLVGFRGRVPEQLSPEIGRYRPRARLQPQAVKAGASKAAEAPGMSELAGGGRRRRAGLAWVASAPRGPSHPARGSSSPPPLILSPRPSAGAGAFPSQIWAFNGGVMPLSRLCFPSLGLERLMGLFLVFRSGMLPAARYSLSL